MSNSFNHLLDNYIVYRFSGFIFYGIFIYLSLTETEDNKGSPILPNPGFLLLILIITFVLTLMTQVIQPTKYSLNWLLTRFGLSSVPPLLGTILAFRFYREERLKKRDPVFEYAAVAMIFVLSTLTLFYLILLLLLYIYGSIATISFYFLSIGMWGFLGITLADSGIFYSDEKKINFEGDKHFTENFKIKSSIFISKLFASKKERLLILSLTWLILTIFLLISSIIGIKPITI